MVKFLTCAGKCSSRFLALAVLTSTLAACGGGSSSDTLPVDEQDLDGDGLSNAEDLDDDGDGTPDIDDPFTDRDGDNIDDVFGASDPDGDGIPIVDQDLDGDGLINSLDSDADGDGIDDVIGGDIFIDLDENGRDDVSGLTESEANSPTVTDQQPCGGEPGSDANSSTPQWNDNCWIRQTEANGDGQFARSLYTVGIQRILWCADIDGSAQPGENYVAFADGIYGNNTANAVFTFQQATSIPNTEQNTFDALLGDTEVGTQTWGKLREAITRLEFGTLPTGASSGTTVRDTYGFAEGPCQGTALFYQTMTYDATTATFQEGGWRLARNIPNQADSIAFSIDPPAGL